MSTIQTIKSAFNNLGSLVVYEEARVDYNIVEKFIKEQELLLEDRLFQELKAGISKRIHLSGEVGALKWAGIAMNHKNHSILEPEKREKLLKKACKANKIDYDNPKAKGV